MEKYKNGGSRKETILFKKSFICGTIPEYLNGSLKANPVSVRVDIKIKQIDLATEVIFNYVDGKKKLIKVGNTKKTTNLIKVNKYNILTISGYSLNSGGQILDTLRDIHFKRTEGFNKKRFLEIWEEWHLNDMQSGTERQQKELNKFKERPKGWSYDEDCEYLKEKNIYIDRGYKFGSSWLIKELPLEIEEELKQLIQEIQ